MPKEKTPCLVLYIVCGTFVYAVSGGFRDNYGIMLPYIVGWSSVSYATVSFIIALGQLLFGFMQPVFGLIALRTSNRFVLFLGAGMMLCGLLSIPLSHSAFLLTLSLGMLLPSGTAAAAFGLIMSCITPRVTPREAHTAAGFVASGCGISICLLSPTIQSIIASRGITGAVFALCIPVLMFIPATWVLTHSSTGQKAVPATSRVAESTGALFAGAFRHPTYRRITFGFFTCGFHMAMIQTHLFSQLAAFGVSERAASYALSTYGLGVVTGAVLSGAACARFLMGRILGVLYGSRCLWVGLLLLPLPVPVLFFIIFLLGVTGPATLAPTSGLVNKCFGAVRLAVLFGFVYLVHQTGAFCSAWAGGLCVELTGSYSGVWYADITLCMLASIACFGVREKA